LTRSRLALQDLEVIRHVLLFRFRDQVCGAEREAMLKELGRFPERYPAMRRFALGVNRSHRDDRFTHAMHVEFDHWDQLDAYLDSGSHEAFVASRFRPLVEERAIASIEVPPQG
jgi:antibiotic biosynthesis monooxygenase (ABM) superfamily enzyme